MGLSTRLCVLQFGKRLKQPIMDSWYFTHKYYHDIPPEAPATHPTYMLQHNPTQTTKFARQIFSSSRLLNEEKFSRFPVPDGAALPEDMKNRITEVGEKAGFVPNVFSALSYRPDELRAFIHYYDIVMEDRGNLTKADKEMIIVATSSENNCLYCIVAHGALHRIYSKSPVLADQLAANWRSADIDDRQRAILDVAMDLCHCKQVPESKIEELQQQGLTMDDFWDIGAVVSLFALSNRMAYTMNLKPNKEFYLMGRVAKEKKS